MLIWRETNLMQLPYLQYASSVDLAQSSGVHVNLRNAFLRRVYGLLTFQLVMTTAICAFCTLHEGTKGLLLGVSACDLV